VKTDDIKSKIKGSIGKEIFFYEKVGSTNTVASSLAEQVAEGAVFLADTQEKGRGRLGRVWLSPLGGNIYMSIILRPQIETKDATLITIMAAVASANALRKTTGLNISIKWPNDLMCNERKIGGILSELKTDQNGILFSVIGIGINVNTDIDAFPEDVREIATSVKKEIGRLFSREEIIAEVLNEINNWYMILKSMKRGVLLAEWQRLTSTLGKEVIVVIGQETYKGFAEAIDDEGMLILRLPSGEMKRIHSGDLTVLR
jgi:BirA family transcriptional regulator, biotin operon repressor / biotin---[acetyl-CoA-carboxylase] ligase